jgi:hypothetical protein
MRKSQSVRTKYATSNDTSEPRNNDEAAKSDHHENEHEESYFVNERKREELKEAEMDLAIVCPLVDGRLKDVAAK